MADTPTGWMDAPQVPKTRLCPQCDGKKGLPDPRRNRAVTLFKEQLRAAGLRVEVSPREEFMLLAQFPPLPCRFCKGTGVIPMEQ